MQVKHADYRGMLSLLKNDALIKLWLLLSMASSAHGRQLARDFSFLLPVASEECQIHRECCENSVDNTGKAERQDPSTGFNFVQLRAFRDAWPHVQVIVSLFWWIFEKIATTYDLWGQEMHISVDASFGFFPEKSRTWSLLESSRVS